MNSTAVDSNDTAMSNNRSSVPNIDGGWAWVVLVCCFLIQVNLGGLFLGFGLYFISISEAFEGSSKAEVAWIGSLAVGLCYLCGPLSSVLIVTQSHRFAILTGAVFISVGFLTSAFAPNIFVLYFTYGILNCLGASCLYLPTLLVVGEYFDRYRNAAISIVTMGSGIGTFFMPPLIQYLTEEYTWRGSFLITSGIALQCIPLGILIRPVPVRRNVEPEWNDNLKVKVVNYNEKPFNKDYGGDGRCGWVNGIIRRLMDCVNTVNSTAIAYMVLFRHVKLTLFALFNVTCCISAAIFFMLMADLAVSKGISIEDSSYLMSMLGIFNLSGRIVNAVCGSFKRIDRTIMLMLFCFPWALSAFVYGIVSSYVLLAAAAATFGLCYGVYCAVFMPVVIDLLGAEQMTYSVSVMAMAMSVGFLIGPPIAAWTVDITGDISVAFHIAGGSMVVVIAIMVTLSGLHLKKIRRLRQYLNNEIIQTSCAVENNSRTGHIVEETCRVTTV